MRLYIEILFILGLLAMAVWKTHANREWSNPDKVVDEFCGMEDLNRYHIQHHHRDLRIIVGMVSITTATCGSSSAWPQP